YEVALGVAGALDYLHNGAGESIIHRDVKSSNILQSHAFGAQLSDFGFAMWVSTMYQVTTGVDDDLQAKPILEGEKVLQLLDPSMGSEVDHDQLEQMMSTEDLLELIREYPLPEGWYARLPGLQEPANYGTKFETGIYEEQTSGYKPDATDFMRVFFEICFVKGVANCPGWYYIHSRQRLLKGGPKSNKKAKGKRKKKQPSAELSPAPKKTRVTPHERSP
ncbi:hypothetical protein RJ640_022765, partial [Escallonia rubra]